jgi:hypothetical protein
MRGPLSRLALRAGTEVHNQLDAETLTRPQPLCEVLAKNEVSTCSTFLLLHFGQLGVLAPCSDSGSTRSKTFSQSRQRYSYVGMHSSILGSSQGGVRPASGAGPQINVEQ